MAPAWRSTGRAQAPPEARYGAYILLVRVERAPAGTLPKALTTMHKLQAGDVGTASRGRKWDETAGPPRARGAPPPQARRSALRTWRTPAAAGTGHTMATWRARP